MYLPLTGDVSSALGVLYKIGSLLNKKNIHWIVGGDFNIDYSDLRKYSTRMRNDLLNWESKFHLVQLIKSPTRTTKNTKSTIDLIYISDINFTSQHGVVCYNISDHDLVYLTFKKIPVDKKEKVSFICHKLVSYNLAILNHKL